MVLKQTDVIKDTDGEVIIKLPAGSVPKTFIKQADGVHLWYEEPPTTSVLRKDYHFYFVYKDGTIPAGVEFLGVVKPDRYSHVYYKLP